MRIGGAIKDAWIILGVTLVLIVLIEVVYRVQASVRRPSTVRIGPPSPFEATAWAAEYWKDHEQEEAVRWQPYVYMRNPTFTGRHITVGRDGHRVVPHSPPNGAPPLRLFFMGGSTTFGWYQRAAYTLPAEATRRVQAKLGTRAHVVPTNFGVPGQTFTQEIIELQLQLRAGARPDVVLFYDGINDVMATVQNGEAGLPQNEANRSDDFQRGRALAAEELPGAAAELRAARRLTISALKRLAFVRALLAKRDAALSAAAMSAPAREPINPRPPTDSLAKALAAVYAANIRLAEALAAAYDFQPIYVWQPALLSTRKPLTARERWLSSDEPIGDLHKAVPDLLRPLAHAAVGDRFIDATTLFDQDSSDVYTDLYGHTYERANPRIVDTLLSPLMAAAERALRKPRLAAAPSERQTPDAPVTVSPGVAQVRAATGRSAVARPR